MYLITKFVCSVCGKFTSGRKPKDGDGTLIYPRRHKNKGVDCEGNLEEAEWVEVPMTEQEEKRFFDKNYKKAKQDYILGLK